MAMRESTDWRPISVGQNISLYRRNLALLDFDALIMGMLIVAGRGAGKSTLIGRSVVWQFLMTQIPGFLADPAAGAVNHVLDKLARTPQPLRDQLAKRIVYVDVSGECGQIASLPLYYRFGDQSFYQVSQRFTDVISLMDPSLSSAPIQGKNALMKLGTTVGMLLYGCGAQITEVISLLTQPEAWERPIRQAIKKYPELKEAYDLFLKEYASLPPKERSSRSDSLTSKLLFLLDPTCRALFGASTPTISIEEIIRDRKIVLLDFSRVTSKELQKFLLLWWWEYITDYIRYRGPGRNHVPLSLVFDELSSVLNFDLEDSADAFAQELDDVVNRLTRNNRLIIVAAYQEHFQVPLRLAKSLLTLGTILFGSTSDIETAAKIMPNVFPYDPYLVKKTQPVYRTAMGATDIIDETTTEFTMEEQAIMQAGRLVGLPKFQFYARIARDEGDIHTKLRRISIENVDRGQYVQMEKVAQIKKILAKRSGRPVEEVLAEIESRQSALLGNGPRHPEHQASLPGKPVYQNHQGQPRSQANTQSKSFGTIKKYDQEKPPAVHSVPVSNSKPVQAAPRENDDSIY